jgi:hypothetical protein
MSKRKPFEELIADFYMRPAIELSLFNFVTGVTHVLPGCEINKAVKLWLQKYGFDEDEYPLQTAIQNFCRIRDSFDDWKKQRAKMRL